MTEPSRAEPAMARPARAATHRRRDIYVGGASLFTSVFSKPAPRISDWLTKCIMWKTQFRDEPKRSHADNLHHAGEDGNVRGEWSDRTLRTSLYTRATLEPVVRGAVMAGAGLIAMVRRCLRRG